MIFLGGQDVNHKVRFGTHVSGLSGVDVWPSLTVAGSSLVPWQRVVRTHGEGRKAGVVLSSLWGWKTF